jgi:hypothetical protein
MAGASSVLPNMLGSASLNCSWHLDDKQGEHMLVHGLPTNQLPPTLEENDSVALLALARMDAAYFYRHAISTWCVFGIQIDIESHCRHILQVLGQLYGT